MNHEPAFWVVWRIGGGSPTVQHPCFRTAKAEAQRLARACPGQTFAVLAAAVAYTKRDLDEVRFTDPDDLDQEIPF